MKTINAANAVIDRHLEILSTAGLGATGAVIVTSGYANDGDSRDNIQDCAVTAGLLGLGGYSGYAAGENTYSQMSEQFAVRHQKAGDTTPTKDVFSQEMTRVGLAVVVPVLSLV